AVVLGNSITLTTTNAPVLFTSTVDATTSGIEGLTVAAGTGSVTFGGAVGGTTALASLAVTGPTTLDANVTTSGAQAYNDPVTLGASTILTSTGAGDISFNQTLDGPFGLIAKTDGGTNFFGVVGGTT